MKAVDIQSLTRAVQASWNAETHYVAITFSAENPSRGQCVISSLVVQDYLGGELVRVAAKGVGIDEKHYYNMLDDGTTIDTTRQQYNGMNVALTLAPVDLKGKYASTREKLLNDDDTRQRYDILSKRVKEYLEVNNAKA